MVTQAGDPIPLTTPTPPPSVPPQAAAPEPDGGGKPDEALVAAIEFLTNLSAPWTVGPVTAKAHAPELLRMIAKQGWQLDDALAAKLTENPEGINNHRAILRHRINDLPKAPPPKAAKPRSRLPPWCRECADGNRAAERNGHIRQVYDEAGNGRPCPKCHPDLTNPA